MTGHSSKPAHNLFCTDHEIRMTFTFLKGPEGGGGGERKKQRPSVNLKCFLIHTEYLSTMDLKKKYFLRLFIHWLLAFQQVTKVFPVPHTLARSRTHVVVFISISWFTETVHLFIYVLLIWIASCFVCLSLLHVVLLDSLTFLVCRRDLYILGISPLLVIFVTSILYYLPLCDLTFHSSHGDHTE